MKNFLRLMAIGTGALALCVACESSSGGDAETSTPSNQDTGSGDPTFAALEIQDDSANSTLTNCEKTPGADIDAAGLYAGTNNKGWLKSCDWAAGTACGTNDHKNPYDAEGAPNAVGTESGYLSLNGGYIRCLWDTSASTSKGAGDSITVFEVGKSSTGSGGKDETYHIRLCKDKAGNCTNNYSNMATGEASFPVSSLF